MAQAPVRSLTVLAVAAAAAAASAARSTLDIDDGAVSSVTAAASGAAERHADHAQMPQRCASVAPPAQAREPQPSSEDVSNCL